MASRFYTITKREIQLCKANNTHKKLYDELVEELIAERYTVKQELALHRQRFDKSEEFAKYSDYCEQCKLKVKNLLQI